MPERPEISHKGTFGKVLNVSGSDYMPGAAYLSSIAALKIGCGYVTLCSSERVINIVAAKSSNIVFSPLKILEEQTKKSDVILVGCGLSTSDESRKIFKSVISFVKDKPLIIDADGLNILSEISTNISLEKMILTPHPKEAASLLKTSTEIILENPKRAAKEISQKYNCVTVLKLHNTVVCSKKNEIYINNTGNSSLAKAGTGDVLAGIITGLAAQGLNLFESAKTGVYIHGLSGEIASKDLTKYCVLPEDVIDYIPMAVQSII